MMETVENHREVASEIEDAILDADLFLKYHAPAKAVNRLLQAVKVYPRAMDLHEKLRELMTWQKRPIEAARHCLMLATLYIERERYDDARERLLEAKQLDSRLSIAPGLEAIRRARTPLHAIPAPVLAAAAHPAFPNSLVSGQLNPISLFDIIQLLENGRLTGALNVMHENAARRVLFNEGNIVGAEAAHETGETALRQILQLNQGAFGFVPAAHPFPVSINALNNTSLLLDTLRTLDEENADTPDTGDWA